MRPYSTARRDRYCRLFPPSANRPEPATAAHSNYLNALEELVDAMTDDGSPLCRRRPDIRIDAGYTYFGQFIDHDLTKDPSSIDEAWRLQPEEIENQRPPLLDLGHMYGRGPWDEEDSRLYEQDDVRLRVGTKMESVVAPAGTVPRSFDLAIGPDDWPLVADTRPIENVIVRQITALFSRLHNAAVEQFRSEITEPLKLFERARLQTTWQFQWFACGDWASKVLDTSVYQSVFLKRRPVVEWSVFSIPIEFSVAAMRFGHSMVRDQYLLSNINESRLLALTSRTREPHALEPEWEIDWGRFFQGASRSGAITAMPIATRIAKTLHQLRMPMLPIFNRGTPIGRESNAFKLPLHTMWRGTGLALASGQTAAREIGQPVLSEKELTCDCDEKLTEQGEVLRKNDLTVETPLWYYILKESEVRENGNRLGPTGSRIVAETIYAALLHNPNSYLNHPEAGNEPPVWVFTGRAKRFYALASLFAHAADLI